MGEMVQWLKFLLCKHEDLSVIFITHVKKLGVVVHAYDPTTRARGEAVDGSLGLMASQRSAW